MLQVPETPCLVVDVAKVRENVRRMQQQVEACGCRLRPHVKTHKMPFFARMQLEAGAAGITCAKVSEAEVMAQGGVKDIFIAYPMVGEFRIRRALALQRQVDRLILAVDSWEGAQRLSQAAVDANTVLEVRLEVDTGAKRTGIPRERLVELGKAVHSLPGLRLTGIYTFKSLVLHDAPTQDNAAAAQEEGELMASLAEQLRQAGIPLEDVSAGSTPTGLLVAQTGLVNEVRPGTYIFADWMLTKENCARLEDIAVRLYATVVSTPEAGYAVLDGGTKTFPTDSPLDTAPGFYPGYAIPLGADGLPDENLQLRRMNEEHGIVTAKNGRTGLQVGQAVELLPIHVCTAVNNFNHVFLWEDGELLQMPVAARGMLV